MKDCFKVVAVSEGEVNDFLKKGWEVIDTEKRRNYDDGEQLRYHLGFSYKKAFGISQEILKLYEKNGLEQELLESKAEEIGEDLKDYENHDYGKTNDPLAIFLEQMDFLLTEEINPRYSKINKRSHVEISKEELDSIDF